MDSTNTKEEIMTIRSVDLWLDDERDIHSSYNFKVETYEDAIDILSTYEVRSISLDHDLGTDKSGYDLACWIERNTAKGLPRLKWNVHSANPVGSKRITAALEMADRYWDAVDATIKNHPSFGIVQEFLEEDEENTLEWFRVRHPQLGELTPFQLILKKNEVSDKILRSFIMKELDLNEDLMDDWK